MGKSIGYVARNQVETETIGRHFADLQRVVSNRFMRENICILIGILKIRIDNISALIQTAAWRWTGSKSLSEPAMSLSADT